MTAAQWLMDLAEADCIAWQIEQMRGAAVARSPLDVAIDKATGREQAVADEAEQLMSRFREITAASRVTGRAS